MDEILTATDFNLKKFTSPKSAFKFRVSAYGLLFENNHILLSKAPYTPLSALPGGGIDEGETAEHAVIREFVEETGYFVFVKKIIDTGFNLFACNGNFFHNVFIFFEVKKASEIIGSITDLEDSLEAKFFDLKSLDLNTVNPIFHSVIKKYLANKC